MYLNFIMDMNPLVYSLCLTKSSGDTVFCSIKLNFCLKSIMLHTKLKRIKLRGGLYCAPFLQNPNPLEGWRAESQKLSIIENCMAGKFFVPAIHTKLKCDRQQAQPIASPLICTFRLLSHHVKLLLHPFCILVICNILT